MVGFACRIERSEPGTIFFLKQWERGDRKPHGPALVLLRVIDKNDRAVLRALA